MEARTNRQKREQIHKLRRRNADLSLEHKRIGERNAQVENKIQTIQNEIKRFRSVNVELAEKIEIELIKAQTFQAAIDKLDREVQNLEQTYSFQKARYEKTASQTETLERELEKLIAKKKAYLKYVKRAAGNEAALKLREDNLRKALVKNDLELKSLDQSRAPAPESLQERVKRMAGADLKEGSVLYHCLRAVIQNMEDNEFEGLTYKTRVNKNKSKMGARLFFQNVSSQYSDLYEHLRPVILELGKKFQTYGAQIQTKVKRGPGGVVSALDITFIVNLPEKSQEAKKREKAAVPADL